MLLEEAHQLEHDLREELKKKYPEHPAIKQFYPSTWKAIDGLYEALYGYKFFMEETT